jgi:hypothetical protein
MTERTATCACGQLQIRVEGEPKFVGVCSCFECQRRTGSAFGVGSYWADEQVTDKIGESSTYRRSSDADRPVEIQFCPRCGSSVYWKVAVFPTLTGIAVGCFADPSFPEPSGSVWNVNRHDWVNLPEHWPSSDKQELSRARE